MTIVFNKLSLEAFLLLSHKNTNTMKNKTPDIYDVSLIMLHKVLVSKNLCKRTYKEAHKIWKIWITLF